MSVPPEGAPEPGGERPPGSPWAPPGAQPPPAWGQQPPAYGQPTWGQQPGAYGQPPWPPPRRGLPGWAWAVIVLAVVGVLGLVAVVGLLTVGLLAGPSSYGDDPALDRLHDACAEGDMNACDDLFYESPPFSDYEEFGDTCGGRREPATSCAEEGP